MRGELGMTIKNIKLRRFGDGFYEATFNTTDGGFLHIIGDNDLKTLFEDALSSIDSKYFDKALSNLDSKYKEIDNGICEICDEKIYGKLFECGHCETVMCSNCAGLNGVFNGTCPKCKSQDMVYQV